MTKPRQVCRIDALSRNLFLDLVTTQYESHVESIGNWTRFAFPVDEYSEVPPEARMDCVEGKCRRQRIELVSCSN